LDRLLLPLVVLWAAASAPGPVAHVLAGRGAVTVRHGGEARAAVEGLALEAGDVVVVPVGGLLLLRVDHNEQVVRLDEDLELAVADIAAVKAPRTDRSVEAQLASLLTPRERESLSQQRLAGAVVRPVAAHVAAPPSRSGTREQLKARIAEQRGEREFDRRLDRLTRDDRLFDDADRRMNLERTAGSGEVKVVLQNGGGTDPAGAAPPANSTAVGDVGPGAFPAAPSVSGADARVQVGSVQAGGPESGEELAALEAELKALESVPALDAQTRACVLGALADQGAVVKAAVGPSLEVRLRRAGDGVKVFVEGALPVPACLQAWAEAHAAELPVGEWVTVELGVP